MHYAVYWEGHYVGTVTATSEAEARARAVENFGPFWGPVEGLVCKPHEPRVPCTRGSGYVVTEGLS